ncbi:CBS domain-containing protein [Streptomyces sp. NPDC058874]|uniref:CBS domain-containing protein n=1 Tax=unclassified Streptomyces TaxID=2593676 RepID=UPI00367F5033
MKTPLVGQVMTRDVVAARAGTSARRLEQLMDRHRIGGVPVVDEDDKVVGVVSRTDLTRRPGESGRAAGLVTAAKLMTTPAVTVHPEQRVAEAARVMERRQVDRLPVVDEEDRLIGITTRRDLLRVFLRTDEEIRAEVAAEITSRLPPSADDLLRIHVREGVVTLHGLPCSTTDPFALLRAAWRVDGVLGVVPRLTTAPS